MVYFNPRTPCGVRLHHPQPQPNRGHFNPRTPCGVRRRLSFLLVPVQNFNPRTPCGVRRLALSVNQYNARFQSTHPLRGATELPDGLDIDDTFQSTHPLRGATLAIIVQSLTYTISIHAPPAGCDRVAQKMALLRDNFNPRTPCGVRRFFRRYGRCASQISIHAPPAGCDVVAHLIILHLIYISIHAPPAGCDKKPRYIRRISKGFQSTHPLRGATADG